MFYQTFLQHFSGACVVATVGTVCLNLQNIAWGPLILHYPWCGFLVFIPASFIYHELLLYHLGCRDMFCYWVVWLRYYWHGSGRPPRCNYFLCLIVLKIVRLGHNIFSVGSNIWRSNSLVFYPELVDKGVTFSASVTAGRWLCWSRCHLDVISDSRGYFEIILSVSPGHVAKYPSLIYWIRVRLVGQQRIWW